MTGKTAVQAEILSPTRRILLGSLFIMLVVLLLIFAASIPFVFESQSLRYKLGIDKTLLRTGKVLGILAAVLLLLQLVLSARLKVLDNIFGLNRLYIVHRISAVTVAVLAVLHPLLVFAPEDITSLPPELKFWPEILGAALLLTIWTITSTALFRRFLDLPFNLWWLAHRAATFVAVIFLFVHVLFVSDTFEQGLPRLIVLGAAGCWAVIFGWVKLKPFLHKRKPYTVIEVEKAARNTYSVTLEPQRGSVLSYLPGQFAFVSFKAENLPAEEHPFTLSSSPTWPQTLQFSIHCSGDWTRKIGLLNAGETAVLDGPYGLFSHLVRAGRQEIVMIAGGIGITPMLSMLRYMADTGDTRRITLIWSNRTREDKVYDQEFHGLEERLPGLRLIDVFTREGDQEEGSGRLDRGMLARLLADCDRRAAVFICGPPLMMKEIKGVMVRLGFKRGFIHLEEFAL